MCLFVCVSRVTCVCVSRMCACVHVLVCARPPQVNLRVAARFLKTCGVPHELFEDGVFVPRPLPTGVTAILLDIVMKKSDGVQVCRELRAAGCTIPIIAMTGNVSE